MSRHDRREAGRELPDPLELDLLISEFESRVSNDEIEEFLEEIRAAEFEGKGAR